MTTAQTKALCEIFDIPELHKLLTQTIGIETVLLKLRTVNRALQKKVVQDSFWKTFIEKTILHDTENVRVLSMRKKEEEEEEEDEDEDESQSKKQEDPLHAFKLRGIMYQIANFALEQTYAISPHAPPFYRYLALIALYNFQSQTDEFGRKVCEYNDNLLPVGDLNETLFYSVGKKQSEKTPELFALGRKSDSFIQLTPGDVAQSFCVLCTTVQTSAGNPITFTLEGFTDLSTYKNCPRPNKALLQPSTYKLLLIECDESTLVEDDAISAAGNFSAFIEKIRQFVRLPTISSHRQVDFSNFSGVLASQRENFFIPIVAPEIETDRIADTRQVLLHKFNVSSSFRIGQFTFPRDSKGEFINPDKFLQALAACLYNDESLKADDINFPVRPNAGIAFTRLPHTFAGFDGPVPKSGDLISTQVYAFFGMHANRGLRKFHPDIVAGNGVPFNPLEEIRIPASLVYSNRDPTYVTANRYHVLKRMVRQEKARAADSRDTILSHCKATNLTEEQKEVFSKGFQQIDGFYSILEEAIANWEAQQEERIKSTRNKNKKK